MNFYMKLVVIINLVIIVSLLYVSWSCLSQDCFYLAIAYLMTGLIYVAFFIFIVSPDLQKKEKIKVEI